MIFSKPLFRRRRGASRTIGLFRRDSRGATAVEFAFVAAPFLMLLFGVLEVGLMLVMNTLLANAAAIQARQFRVGSAVASGVGMTTSSGSQIDLADLKTAICKSIPLVPTASCQSQLQIDIRTASSFQSVAPPSPFSGKSFSTANFCLYSGSSGSVVEMRTYYLWPLITPVLLNTLVNVTSLTTSGGTSSGNWVALSDTEVFVNEPNPNLSNSSSTTC